MVDIIQLTGYLAGFIIAIALTPQVIKAWTTKSTRDISLLWNMVLTIGLILYLIYGVGISEMPIIVMTLLELALAVSLTVAKLIYK